MTKTGRARRKVFRSIKQMIKLGEQDGVDFSKADPWDMTKACVAQEKLGLRNSRKITPEILHSLYF